MEIETTNTLSSPCIYKRRDSIEVMIGNKPLGGKNPIRIQTMANVSTMNTKLAIEQASRIIKAGADYLRYTAQGVREATNLGIIDIELRKRSEYIPLIADIHFNPKAADKALETVDKVRINPGNFVDTKSTTPREWTDEVFSEFHKKVEQQFGEFVEKAKRLHKAIRIGVNHGSLSERMVMKYGDTPQGMVQSCLEFLDVCRKHNFHDVVISMKSSNTIVMTNAVRLLVDTLDERGYPAYPIHLGVTEAGEGEDGRIKSAVGIGALLSDGIGDTIRVSLSEEPEAEVPVAQFLVDYISNRANESQIISTPPSWLEYKTLSKNDRSNTTQIKQIIGGENPCIVLSNQLFKPKDEVKPDYALLAQNKLSLSSALSMIAVPIIEIVGYNGISNEILDSLTKQKEQSIIVLRSITYNAVAEWRYLFIQLRKLGIMAPIVLAKNYQEQDLEHLQLMCAVDYGTVLLDGIGNGILIENEYIAPKQLVQLSFNILQATRLRMTKTEFISCPGCGRTLFDLQTTIANIKKSTNHLKGLKIGIMGCIVNGPGEMADADYGYVGAAPGKIDMYKGQKCVVKGVPQEYAVDTLINLIKENNQWVDPE